MIVKNASKSIAKGIQHISFVTCLGFSVSAYAAHPLVSDDTGTQGVGAYQVELNTDWLKDEGVKTRTATTTLTKGVLENLDLYLNMPYALSEPNGFNDVSIGLKWRFLEADGFSLGLKPEFRLASGDQEKGLGDGRSGEALSLIAQYEWGAWTWLFNVGSERHRFSDPTAQDESRRYINKSSVALMYEINEQWHAVVDTGISSHETKAEKKDPRFMLLGLIHHVNDDLDLDVGYKKSLNSTETDRQIGVGVTYRFK